MGRRPLAGGAATWVRVGCKTMMIASWKYVLETGYWMLPVPGGTTRSIGYDLLQLQGADGLDGLQRHSCRCATMRSPIRTTARRLDELHR